MSLDHAADPSDSDPAQPHWFDPTGCVTCGCGLNPEPDYAADGRVLCDDCHHAETSTE